MFRTPILLAVAVLGTACRSYAPSPVDLTAHARAFADRLPLMLEAPPGGAAPFDVSDGLSREEARPLALLCHPDCRLARRRAGVAQAVRDEAGRWVDPRINGNFERILESVPHRWLVGAGLGLTIPLTGRLGRERDLAAARFDAAELAARLVEQQTALALDDAWFRWSATRQRRLAIAAVAERIVELAAVATRLRSAGAIDAPAARVFELERLRQQDALLTVTAAETTARLQLLQRLGLPPTAELELVPSLIAPAPPKGAADRAQLANGPRVALAQQRHLASERALELEIARQWPDLNLVPGWTEEDAQPRFTFGFTLPLPLWNGNVQAIEAATARRELRAEELRVELEQAHHALAQAEVALQVAAARRRLLGEQLAPLADRQLRDSRALAENGQLEPLLLLDSLRRVLAAQLDVIDATLAECRSALTMQQLFWIELPTMAEKPTTAETDA